MHTEEIILDQISLGGTTTSCDGMLFRKNIQASNEHGIVMLTSEEKAYLHHWGVKKTLNVFRFVALVCW